MASFVTGILGSAADGEAFTGQAHRLGMASHATIVNDGVGPLTSRSGIIPGGGTPLDVTALGTPAMRVTVKAGTCAVQSTDTTGGVHTVTLTTATDLDIAAANATNPRIDLVVVKVFADGTSATTCTVEVITGTAAASPVRPSIASPPTNTHYFPLAQIRVEANATTIVAAKVTKASGDGQYTCAPGGSWRYALRHWSGVRSSDSVVLSSGSGNFCGALVTAAECLPGIYLAVYTAMVLGSGTGSNLINVKYINPDSTITNPYTFRTGEFSTFSTTRVTVFDAQPGTNKLWSLDADVGGNPVSATFLTNSRVDVWRMTDL